MSSPDAAPCLDPAASQMGHETRRKLGIFMKRFPAALQGRKRFNYKKPQKTNLCNGNGNYVFPCDPAAILCLLTKKPRFLGFATGTGPGTARAASYRT